MLSNRTSSKPKQEYEDHSTMDQPTSEKISSSNYTPGNKKLKIQLPEDLTDEELMSYSTPKEESVNQNSANTCAGTIKYLCWDGGKLVTCYIWCLRCKTNPRTYSIFHDPNRKIGDGMTTLQLLKESRMDYSSTQNTNARKLL